MKEQLYELLQEYKSPTEFIAKGTVKTALAWCEIFLSYIPLKTIYKDWVEERPDWFRPVKDRLDEILFNEMQIITGTFFTDKTFPLVKEISKRVATRYHQSEMNNTLEEIIREVFDKTNYKELSAQQDQPIRIAISVIKSYIK